jgi:hypothetical protein
VAVGASVVSNGRLRELFVQAGSSAVSRCTRDCSGGNAAVGGLLFAKETKAKPALQALDPAGGNRVLKVTAEPSMFFNA